MAISHAATKPLPRSPPKLWTRSSRLLPFTPHSTESDGDGGVEGTGDDEDPTEEAQATEDEEAASAVSF
jgi:hypothetical protein